MTATLLKTKNTDRTIDTNQPFIFCIKCQNGNVEYYEPHKKCTPKCGDIWMCEFPKTENGVQSGFRPAFILSNDKNNMHSPTVNVIPMTTKMNKRNLPCHVEIWDYGKFGLNAPSTILVEQTTTVPVTNLKRRVGQIDDSRVLTDICKAMKVQFPIFSVL